VDKLEKVQQECINLQDAVNLKMEDESLYSDDENFDEDDNDSN
jgi:hypothetical protein